MSSNKMRIHGSLSNALQVLILTINSLITVHINDIYKALEGGGVPVSHIPFIILKNIPYP